MVKPSIKVLIPVVSTKILGLLSSPVRITYHLIFKKNNNTKIISSYYYTTNYNLFHLQSHFHELLSFLS